MTLVAAHLLGPVDQVPEGEGRTFTVAGAQIVVFRLKDGTLRALDAVCPHRSGPLADGQIDAQVQTSPETLEAVQGLERSYDAAADGRSLAGPGLLAPTLPDDEMPGGDELADELPRYLRSMDGEQQA